MEFDAIWQRHKRLLIQKTIAWTVGMFLVLAALIGVWMSSQPVDVEVRLNEASVHNENLPPLKDAVITITLDNETKTDTINTMDAITVFNNIPHRLINKEVCVRMKCENFLPIDTTLLLSKSICINISRNPDVYGNIRFKLWNPDTERTSPNTSIIINGYGTKSDSDGYVTLSIPLGEQKTAYPVSSTSLSLVDSIICPPCGPDDVIIFK